MLPAAQRRTTGPAPKLRRLRPYPRLPAPAQPAALRAPAARRRLPRAVRIAVIGLPVLLVAIVAGFLVPVLIEAQQAYEQVFVTPVPRPRIVINSNGTPEIVLQPTAPTTASTSGQGTQEPPTAAPTEDPLAGLPNWDQKERINVLLLGLDLRDTGEVSRSDTMIIVTINPATEHVGMLSIPRDLLVTIPSYGNDRINAAYPIGQQSEISGPGLIRATIEYNFKIPIHYYAEVEIEGMERIIDTLGGVMIDVAAPIKDDEYPWDESNYTRVYFETGLQQMDGRTAVRYARTRHDDNDFARGSRQQQLLQALREQGIELDLIRKAPDLLHELADSFRTDLSPSQVLALARLGHGISNENIHTYGLIQATSVQWLPGQPYYLIPNWPAINAIIEDMMSH